MPNPTPTNYLPLRWTWRGVPTHAGTYYEILDGGVPAMYTYNPSMAVRAMLALNAFDLLLAKSGGCPCNTNINTIN